MDEYSNLPSDMLRPTKRLQEHAKSLGGVIIEDGECPDDTLFHLQEVEFVSGFHGFNFWMLEALLKRSIDCRMPYFEEIENLSHLLYRREPDNTRVLESTKQEPIKLCFDNQSVNILWLSPNEFVSPISFVCSYTYSVEFSFNKRFTKWSSLKLYAYHIDNFFTNHDELSFPEVTLHFLQHIVPPVADRITKIGFHLSTDAKHTPPTAVASMLELVPTNMAGQGVREKNDYLRVLFEGELSEEHVEVFLCYPFHPNVRFGFEMCEGLTAGRYNQLLLQFQHLRHIEVPYDLEYMSIDCGDSPFTANIAFESLTVTVQKKFPLKVMEGISANPNIQHLIVHHYRETQCNNTKRNVSELLRRKIKSLTAFTVQCFLTSCEDSSCKAPHLQACFSDWCRFLCTGDNRKLIQSWELSSFRFEFEDGREEPFIKVNRAHPAERWDTLAMPSLALNWYRQTQQPQSLSPVVPAQEIRMIPLAIWAVNHGVVYRKTTNIIPLNMSASSSTVIYAMLQQNLNSLIKSQSRANVQARPASPI
jgi:hypothetical protein